MAWLAFTALSICIGLLIRAALRAVVAGMEADGRWTDDWRVGVGSEGIALAVHDHDLAGSEPHCEALLPTTRDGAPTTGRGTIGLNVGG